MAVLEQLQQDDLLTNMVSPFSSNPFERQTQSFIDRLRADEERQRREIAARAEQRAKNLQLARKRQAERQQSQLATMELKSFIEDPLSRTVQPGSGFELAPTTPIAQQAPVVQPEERFEFGSFFGSGVLENVAKKSLDVIELILSVFSEAFEKKLLPKNPLVVVLPDSYSLH